MDDIAPPADILALAQERARARAGGDWSRADELRARITAHGWLVVDDGPAFSLHPSRPADLVEAGHTWYGSLDSVPSRLSEPTTAVATVVVVAGEDGTTVRSTLEALAAHQPTGTQLVVVAPMNAAVQGPADEVVGTIEPFGAGEALQAGLRRASGRVVVVLDPARRPTGDVVSPLVAALDASDVAVAGEHGLLTNDLHHYQAASGGELSSVAAGCWAFRRDDLAARGPVDRRLQLAASVAKWVSLLLRDEGPDVPPRRAVSVELPLVPAHDGAEALPSRAARRDGYRISDRFRDRPWLMAGQLPPAGRVVGDGAEQHDRDEGDQQGHQSGRP